MPDRNFLNWFGRKDNGPQQLPTTSDGKTHFDADPAAVAQALDALLNTDRWDDTRRILDRQQALLLTLTAQLLLTAAIMDARQQGDDLAAQRRLDLLALHLDLLRDAKDTSITEAWRRFEATLRQRGELGGSPSDGAPPAESGADQGDPFLAWIDISNFREDRRFLETHPGLVNNPATQARIQVAITFVQAQADELFAALKPWIEAALKQPGPLPDDLELALGNWREMLQAIDSERARLARLRDIHVRAAHLGGDLTAAIREAYVNARAGFMLDVPPWLEADERRDAELAAKDDTDQTAPARFAIWRAGLQRAERERLEPEIVAELHARIFDALHNLRTGEIEIAQEEGIGHLETALRVYTLARLPFQYAGMQNNLGSAYLARLRGDKAANQDAAINSFREALKVYTLANYPLDYATAQNNLGALYRERLRGNKAANQEVAIACFREALSVRTFERLPLEYATVQTNLGAAYLERRGGEWEANQEMALICYQEALRVFTMKRLPYRYAISQHNLGVVYAERRRGEKAADREAALTCFWEALRVRTLERFPQDHRNTQLNMGFACVDYGMWEQAHAAYQGALAAEELLLAQVSGGLQSSDTVLRQGREAAPRDGYALTQLGRDIEAALTVERGRARGLAEARLRASGDPAEISDSDRRRRYQQALAAFNRAQATSNAPITRDDLRTLGGLDLATLPAEAAAREAFIEQAQRKVELARSAASSAARQAFDTIVAEIRAASDPADFLLAPLDEVTLWRAASIGGPGHGVVYLIATRWGGAAIAALTANPALKTTSRCLTLGLPTLTETLVDDLMERVIPSGERPVVAGFARAQKGRGFGRFLYDWDGETFREKAAALQRGCAAAGVALGQATLATAAQTTLHQLGASPHFSPLLDAQLATLPTDDAQGLARLDAVFEAAFLRAELTYSLATLADAALRPLAAWLIEQGATSVTLIPCGGLGTFPLLATPIAPAGPGETSVRVFADAFPKGASVAPSARALLRIEPDGRDQAAWQVKQRRSGVIALGDPRSGQASHSKQAPLPWSEAEAITFARLARKAELPAESRINMMALRSWLLTALQSAWVADLSCHGIFNSASPLDSALLLALDTTLTLRDLLSLGRTDDGSGRRQTDLRGMRLLILSACQTAILDLLGARDEARSLAAGILEAGAEAALASQWSVNDKATYLLMIKFAQLWFPNRERMAPAVALTLAQRWLRNVTNAELRKWRAATLAPITADERKDASGEADGADPWESEQQQQAANVAALAQAQSVFAGQPTQAAADGLVVSRLRGLRPRRQPDLADDERAGSDGVRGERYGFKDAEEQIHIAAASERDDDCPFADPFYWAGFQITGW